MKNYLSHSSLVAMLMGCLANTGWAADSATLAWKELQQQWDVASYQVADEDEREDAFEKLIAKADAYVEQYPNDANVLIWRGIILSSFAGVKGGLGALKYVKASKVDLEKAISIDPKALSGSAQTSLGTLYFMVPGWPVGFGDDEKAEELLKQGLAISPDDIDANFFYAQYLYEEGEYEKAQQYFIKANNASKRPGREIADQGRREEIAEELAKVRKKLD